MPFIRIGEHYFDPDQVVGFSYMDQYGDSVGSILLKSGHQINLMDQEVSSFLNWLCGCGELIEDITEELDFG